MNVNNNCPKCLRIGGRIFLSDETAALDVDTMKCFTSLCPNELPVPGGHLIVSELNKQAKKAKYRVVSKDAHNEHAKWVATEEEPQQSPMKARCMDMRWNRHGEPGTKGFELLDGLPDVLDYSYVVWKGIELHMHPYGACYHDLEENLSTGLIEVMRSWGVKNVIAGGLATNYCYITTVRQLVKAGFTVIVNLGACRGLGEAETAVAIEEMRAMPNVIIVNSADEIETID